MSCKDLIVQIDGAAGPARYQITANLAARAGGCVTGLYLKTTLINPFNNIDVLGSMPPGELDRLIREHNRGQDEAAAKAAAILSDIAVQAKVRGASRVIGGDTPQELIAEARLADLVVMGAPSPSPDYNVHASPIDVVLGGGGPVLIVPDDAGQASIGARALIAWNGSREAARALRDALPLLAPGAEVEVRIAHPKDEEPATASLRRHLDRHGLRSNIEAVADEGQSIADWLTGEAVRTGCDLMIMGLYGHARLQEFVLGGVSRDLLHRPPLPLLVSH